MSEQKGLIVVADDKRQIVYLLSQRVKEWGFRCVGATDKAQLLDALAHERPCLLILDLHFGESNGIELLGQLLEMYPGLRTVMLTGHGSIVNAVTAIKHGAYDFLTNPPEWPRLE